MRFPKEGMKTFFPQFTSQEELKTAQLQGLQWTVNHAYHGSPTYRQKLTEAQVRPEHIQSLDDLQKLPFTTAEDLAAGYPFPLLSVPMRDVVRVHSSSGTTGKRKVLCYTKKDVADWTHFFARGFELARLTPEDRVQNCVGYGLWTAGVGFQAACEALGAMSIPTGPGNLEMQMEFLIDFQTTALCCTASMGLLLAEEVERRGLLNQLNLKKMFYGSERSSDAMREKIKTLLNLEDMHDTPGMTEIYGPGTGMECTAHQGMHYWADYFLYEIVHPETLKPVKDGEVGEMVVTTLQKEAAPLIRYRTRDLSAFLPEPCPCGNLFPRHDRFLGRSDDMFTFRGVNIYPSQIENILNAFSEIGSEYQIQLAHNSQGKDTMTLRVERNQAVDSFQDSQKTEKIQKAIKNKMFVTPVVEIVDYAALPRSERKTQRVFDQR